MPLLSRRWVPVIPTCASTLASQRQNRQNTALMAGKSLLPSHDSPFQAPVTLMKVCELHRPLQKCSIKNLKIVVNKTTTYHVSLHLWDNCWMLAKLVDRLTAKLVDRLTTKLVDRLTTIKLMDRLTAEVVVVNLVKFHLTKLNSKFKACFQSSMLPWQQSKSYFKT